MRSAGDAIFVFNGGKLRLKDSLVGSRTGSPITLNPQVPIDVELVNISGRIRTATTGVEFAEMR